MYARDAGAGREVARDDRGRIAGRQVQEAGTAQLPP
jgi:hypothetical protein